MARSEGSYSLSQKILAWSVHAFTSLGAVAGLFAIIYISRHQFEHACLALMIAFVIDGIDGTFARLFKVKEVLPSMDGKNIDYVVDFANYAIIPAYFIYEAGWNVTDGYQFLLPESLRWLAVSAILVTSALYYGRDGMVSSDNYFMGFPVLWNVVAFYCYFIFDWSPEINLALILFLCLAQFFPVKILYPSRSPHFRILNIIASFTIVTSNVAFIFLMRNQDWYPVLRWISLLSLIYFILMSLYITFFYRPKA